MQYKSIVHELLQQRPAMHEQLRKERKLLPTLEMYARELKTSHEAWQEMLLGLRPGSDRNQIASKAFEFGPEGNGGSFALRFLPGRQRTAIPRRGYAFPPPSHVAHLKASRSRPTLFRLPVHGIANSADALVPLPAIFLPPHQPRLGPSVMSLYSARRAVQAEIGFPLKVSPSFRWHGRCASGAPARG